MKAQFSEIRRLGQRVSATALALALVMVAGCGKEAATLPPVIGQMPNGLPQVPTATGGYQGGLPSAIDHGPNGPARVVMKNVRFRIGPKMYCDVPALDGVKLPNTPGAPIVMDDPTSFTMVIQNGAFLLDEENTASLMNNYVMNYPDAPLKDLTAFLSPGRMGMKGKMRMAGMDVPFEMEGAPRAMANGKIEMIPDKIKALGLPQQGLLKLIGLEMDKLVKVKEGRGLMIEGNSVIMDPTKMLPPPAINGRVTHVDVQPDPKDGKMKMMIIFGNGPQAVRDERLPAPNAPNYIHIWGGVVRFVNTYNTFTNLQIVDSEPSDPFDFYLNEYGVQMQAGAIILSPMGWTLSIQPDYTRRNQPVWPNVPGFLLPNGSNGGGNYTPGGNYGGYPQTGSGQVGTASARRR